MSGKDGTAGAERRQPKDIDEIRQTIERCVMCGLCLANCPTYKAILSERISARGRAFLIGKETLDETYFHCTLCKACDVMCPAGVPLSEAIRRMRELMVERGLRIEANERMIGNIRKHGNPFGETKKGEIPKDLYCC
ncbi:(Fe-S)-binding protein [Candidatus Woesearchaeota archaeon]|nr:(Fe-S)-binding protein [Candidatus Woesearchaeota archaeon]